MSLQTWKDEFYPIDVYDVSEEDALAHSLTKWQGLEKHNLDNHDVKLNKKNHVAEKMSREEFKINDSSCALCLYYSEDSRHYAENFPCFECPIFTETGKRCCGFIGSAWRIWNTDQNPLPMIELLKRTQRWLKIKIEEVKI